MAGVTLPVRVVCIRWHISVCVVLVAADSRVGVWASPLDLDTAVAMWDQLIGSKFGLMADWSEFMTTAFGKAINKVSLWKEISPLA